MYAQRKRFYRHCQDRDNWAKGSVHGLMVLVGAYHPIGLLVQPPVVQHAQTMTQTRVTLSCPIPP